MLRRPELVVLGVVAFAATLTAAVLLRTGLTAMPRSGYADTLMIGGVVFVAVTMYVVREILRRL
jgi:hypothetical protein